MAVQAAMDAQMSVSRLLLPLLLVQDPVHRHHSKHPGQTQHTGPGRIEH